MANPTDSPPPDVRRTLSLYRKFVWTDALRRDFDRVMARDGPTLTHAVATNTVGSFEELFEPDMYMSLWFATLYIVIEGWPALRARDERLTVLLREPYKALLKDFRDAVFHPSDFQDSAMDGLIDRGRHSMDWVREVTSAFQHFFQPIAEEDRKLRRYRLDTGTA